MEVSSAMFKVLHAVGFGALFAACLTSHGWAWEDVPYPLTHITGEAGEGPRYPALRFDASLDASGKFQQIKIDYDGQSFDLLDVPGAEVLKRLEFVELQALTFSYGGKRSSDPGFSVAPYLTVSYEPSAMQRGFCENHESFRLSMSVRDRKIILIQAYCHVPRANSTRKVNLGAPD